MTTREYNTDVVSNEEENGHDVHIVNDNKENMGPIRPHCLCHYVPLPRSMGPMPLDRWRIWEGGMNEGPRKWEAQVVCYESKAR